MSGNHVIAGLSTRPQPGSKTSAAIQNLIHSMEDAFSFSADFFELSVLNGSLRAASFRVELGGPAKYALDKIEQSKLLVLGVSVKAPAGYPAMLRYLFEMADPAALRDKPTILVKTHCNLSTQHGTEPELDMLMRAFGLNVVSGIRISSRELLQGAAPDEREIQHIMTTLYRLGLNSDDWITHQFRQARIN